MEYIREVYAEVVLKPSNSLWKILKYKSLKNTNTSTEFYDHIRIFVNTSQGSSFIFSLRFP